MRAVVIPKYGPPGVLRIEERPDPVPERDQILVDVRACGVNFADVMMRAGLYPEAPKPPFIPGYEVAGLAGGRRVLAVTRFNGYADKVVVPSSKVFDLPEDLSFEEAAGFPVATLTAWAALEGLARVREGDRVLIHGAAGGVGLAAVAIAGRKTDQITGTVGTQEKADFVRHRGVRAVVRDLDPLKGPFDVILNPVGGKSIEEDMGRLAPFGRIVIFGASTVVPPRKRNLFRAVGFLLAQPKFKPIELQHRNLGVMGLNLLKLWDRDELLGRAMTDLLPGAASWLKPHIDRTFPLEKAADAHRHLHDRKNIGKVVLLCGARDD